MKSEFSTGKQTPPAVCLVTIYVFVLYGLPGKELKRDTKE